MLNMACILFIAVTNGISWQSSPCRREEQYDGYLQLENGVGMLRLLDTEIQETVQGLEGNDTLRHFSVATGKLAAPYIEKNISYVQEKFPNYSWEVYAIRNDFFGPIDHRIRSESQDRI